MTVTLTGGTSAKISLHNVMPTGGGSLEAVALTLTLELPLSELVSAIDALRNVQPGSKLPPARSLSPPSPGQSRGRSRGRTRKNDVLAPLRDPSRDLSRDPMRGTRDTRDISPSPARSRSLDSTFVAFAGDFPAFDPFEQIDADVNFTFQPSPRGVGGDRGLSEIAEDTPKPGVAFAPGAEDAAAQPALATLRGHSSWVNGVAWAPDGSKLVTSSAHHTACIWQPSGPQPWQWRAAKTLRAHCDGNRDGFRAVAWSSDSTRLAAACMDNEARIFRVAGTDHRNWDVCGKIRGHTDVVRAIAWSPSGTKVVTGSDDKTARIWRSSRTDAGNWEQFALLRGHSDAVRAVAWCPDKLTIATGSADATICLWHAHSLDPRVWEIAHTLSGHAGVIKSLDWSPDGAVLLSGGEDATARMWSCSGCEGSLRLWQEVATLTNEYEASLKSVAWAQNGCRLAAAGSDATARVWELSASSPFQWELVATFTGHSAAVRTLAWSPDSSKLLTGSADRTARIWEVR
eukprot:TRINITY_DN17928_c0_g1_i1.p1 TRINITY_DN17928_c0_g1~~TRINITY_DN17928_c0_g1_i1.p1  ORF type:complete len:527 (+),score=66.84 TRINITY_DN17928_c0_g1_i1:39-1583(+)